MRGPVARSGPKGRAERRRGRRKRWRHGVDGIEIRCI